MPDDLTDAEAFQRFLADGLREYQSIQERYPNAQGWAYAHHGAERCRCEECTWRRAKYGPPPPEYYAERAQMLYWRLTDLKRSELNFRRERWQARSRKWTPIILARDSNTCQTCGATTNLCIDHKIPLSLGGETCEDNLWTLCKTCNARKGTRLVPFQLNLLTTGKAAVARG